MQNINYLEDLEHQFESFLTLQNSVKEKDDKIGEIVKRFNDMECRELENNQHPTHG